MSINEEEESDLDDPLHPRQPVVRRAKQQPSIAELDPELEDHPDVADQADGSNDEYDALVGDLVSQYDSDEGFEMDPIASEPKRKGRGVCYSERFTL